MLQDYLFYFQHTFSKMCYCFWVTRHGALLPEFLHIYNHFLMSLFLWSMPSVRAQGELHSYLFLVLHSRASTSTQPLSFLSCFLSNDHCLTQAYSLPITVFNTLPRPKLCIISSARWKDRLPHVFIKIMITDVKYLIMRRLIKTGFAFKLPK